MDLRDFVFLPLVYRLAATLEQMTWHDLAEDPPSATYALRSARSLFGLSAMVTHFRVGVEAEACGADLGRDDEGDWSAPRGLADAAALTAEALDRAPVAQTLDVTRRLAEELRGTAAAVGVVTGPRTLGALFDGRPDLGQFYAALARAYAERGVQMLLVVERPGSGPAPEGFSFAPLFNVLNYFRVPAVLLDPEHATPTAGFRLAAQRPLPLAALEGEPSNVEVWRREGGPLLLTEWEVPPRLPAQRLAAWVEAFTRGARVVHG